MKGKKIFNDPVYGFITVPYGILFDLIEHPYFQRLRRIKQLSLTHYVYPGALHTRFHHALGALHLMQQAIEVLKSKGAKISKKEEEGVCIAILLHDIGHGPFSHTLEHTLMEISHEEMSALFMDELNKEFKGKLSLAIKIFSNEYEKQYLHQLVSSQLDMDRLDYLNRDSFFTGVSEGVIGYDRIIKMLAVHNNELVVEEKGIYSIEKFLIARRLMYWQVYLHKTVTSAEQMLIQVMKRAKDLVKKGRKLPVPKRLNFFFYENIKKNNYLFHRKELLKNFSELDDGDIFYCLKNFEENEDPVLAYLASSIIHRNLFRLEFYPKQIKSDLVKQIRQQVATKRKLTKKESKYLVFKGAEANLPYSTSKEEIKILFKTGKVLPMSETTDYRIHSRIVTRYYLCYPKLKS